MPPGSLLASLPPAPAERTGWPWHVETSPACYAHRSDWPRISIVTPSFNQTAFVEETIRSVLLQNYPNLQYIVMDGGSTDSTVSILENYSPWIDYWVSERDRGQSHAINKGLARCDGEWFNWINSDDYLLPAALAKLADAGRDQSVQILAGVTRNVRDGCAFGSYSASMRAPWPQGLFFLGVNQPGSLVRLAGLRADGPVRDDLKFCMDLELWLRLLLRHGPGAMCLAPETVAAYRYHAESKTCSADDAFALEEFAVLTDMVFSVPGVALEPVRWGRQQCPAAMRSCSSPVPLDSAGATKAYLDRLLVSDSLLFRSLRRAPSRPAPLADCFLDLLRTLNPFLVSHFSAAVARSAQATALIRAMQHLGRLQFRMAVRALTLSPRPKTAVELLRIAYRSFFPS
jgi:hypothetical protein